MSNDNCPDDVIVQIGSPSSLNMEVGSRGGGAVLSAELSARGGAAELGRRLLLAARAGDSRLVLALMAHGAPFASDWLGTSALHLAAGAGHAHTCGVLLRAGVSRDARTKVERTPLHVAAAAGHAPVVALLLQHGAAVDCRDMLGMTALHWAAARGHASVARALLAAGAEARARSRFLHTPADLAARAGHRALQRHILEYQNQETQEPKVIFDTEQNERAPSPAAPAPRDLPALDAELTDPHNTLLYALTNNGIIDAENVSQGAPAGPPAPPSPPPPTVVGAVASGRSLVLSGTLLHLPQPMQQISRTLFTEDAGKIMLKESAPPPAPAPAPAPTAAARPAPAPAGARLVSIGNKLFSLAPAEQLESQVTNVKFLQIPSEKISSIKYPLKAKQRASAPRAAPTAAAAVPPAAPAAPAAPARPTVKIIMNKANFSKLLAQNNNAVPLQFPARPVSPGPPASTAAAAAAVAGGEDEAARLRRELAAARATIAALSAQLQRRRPQ